MPLPETVRTSARHRLLFAFGVIAVAAVVALLPAPCFAQSSWPERPPHLIVPFPAGSSSDIVGRLVAQKLGERLGQQIVVENRPGASGNLRPAPVAPAAAGGYPLG